MLGVSRSTLISPTFTWRPQCGKRVARPGGGRCKIYPRAGIERIVTARAAAEAARAASLADAKANWPPAGWVGQGGAAARLAVNERTLREWIADGRLGYAGEKRQGPGGRWYRLFDVASLDRAHEAMQAADAERANLPDGFVSREEAARLLDIAPDTLALWHTNGRLRCGQWFNGPGGKRAKIYPTAKVERLREKLDAERAARSAPPEGFVDIDGASAMFGVSRMAWVIWVRQRKVPRGQWQLAFPKGRRRIWSIAELKRLREALRGEDKVFRLGGRSGRYHIPDDWVQLREACAMFGVDPNTFVRWEREGIIVCGRSEGGRRIKIYPRDELERMVADYGRFGPPYPDPMRPDRWRVPLAGHGIQRREAIIDRADLPLVEGRRWHFCDYEGSDGHLGKVQTFLRGESRGLHQLILGVSGVETVVGHRNDDPLDCRRENLVLRTRSESGAAKRKAKTFCGRPPTSRFKGVCWDRRKEKWKAYVKKDRVMRNLGHFHDEVAAAQVYDEAARELFGEHARLNFPVGVDPWIGRQAA